MFRVNYQSKVVIRPEGKGARFAANSPKNGSCEKFLKKFFGRGSPGELRLETGISEGEGCVNLMLRYM